MARETGLQNGPQNGPGPPPDAPPLPIMNLASFFLVKKKQTIHSGLSGGKH